MNSSSVARPGHLYLVPTPIGNLEDLTFRAIGILKTVDWIAAEDTRHTGKLLQHFQIQTRQISFHQHNTQQRIPHLLGLLQAQKSLALVSDAGMPGISDPGQELVVACIQQGIPVIPLPGANAALTGLIGSGLATNRFVFEGFLETKRKLRHQILRRLAREERTIILYESPHRLGETLREFQQFFQPDRLIVICRELTKLHEEFWRGTMTEAAQFFQEHPVKGEITILLAGAESLSKEYPSEEIELFLQDLLQKGLSPSQASAQLAETLNISKNQIYSLAIRLANASE